MLRLLLRVPFHMIDLALVMRSIPLSWSLPPLAVNRKHPQMTQ